jgi:hypothetical protein
MDEPAVTADMARTVIALRNGERNRMSASGTEFHGTDERDRKDLRRRKSPLCNRQVNDAQKCITAKESN